MKHAWIISGLMGCLICSQAFADRECKTSSSGSTACGYNCIETYGHDIVCADRPDMQ